MDCPLCGGEFPYPASLGEIVCANGHRFKLAADQPVEYPNVIALQVFDRSEGGDGKWVTLDELYSTEPSQDLR